MLRVGKTAEAAIGNWRCDHDAVVALPDHTRSLDVSQALSVLSQHVAGDILPIIGLGLHRQMTKEELKPIEEWGPIQHNPDICSPTKVIDGIPGLVHPEVLKTNTVVSIGVVEPHQYAGFSGGHKGVAVGLGGRDTILALHAKKKVLQDGVRLGQLENNPFRQTIDQLGEAAGCTHTLLFVPKTKQWVFGPPVPALKKASVLASPFYVVDHLFSEVRLKIPPSKGRTFYQASRAATYLALSPNPPLRDNAVLMIEAPLSEGLGSQWGFCEAISRSAPPWTHVLESEHLIGDGAQRALMLALTAKKYNIKIIGCDNPVIFQEIGMSATSEIPPPNRHTLLLNTPFQMIPQRLSC